MKQVIIVRTDLKMRRGKEVSQGSHASVKAVLDYLHHPNIKMWMNDIFTKIVVGVDSVEELLDLYDRFKRDTDLPCSLIQDSGKTEFNNVPTYTAIALGPADANDLDPYTRSLSLR